MKSFDQTFSKVCGVLGQRPESLVATSETLPRRFFGSFFAATCSKKERKRFSHINNYAWRGILISRAYLLIFALKYQRISQNPVAQRCVAEIPMKIG
jgi:hypothetical protein